MRKSPSSAFSLIELLVVLGIIGILLGICLTGFSYLQSKQDRKQAKVELAALKSSVLAYHGEWGNFPNCPEKICTQAECLFLSLFGFHNADGNLQVPPLRTTIPNSLFGYDLSRFDAAEIPEITHGDDDSLNLWLAEILQKDPAFLDPWGNEYVYEFPREDGNPGFLLFSRGPDGKTGEHHSTDDIH